MHVSIKEFFKPLLPGMDVFSRALYTIDIGQNDLTAAYLLNLTVDEVKAIVPGILKQFSDVIKLLYSQEGRSFWIHNGPMGCLTYFVDRFPDAETTLFDEYGCYIPYNDVSKFFNLRLKETVLQLRKEFRRAAITYDDIYSAKYSLIRQARQQGFEDPLLVCCGWGGGKHNFNPFFLCENTKVVDGKTIYAKSCKDPSVRMSWDGIRFTEAANRWFFNNIVDGSFSDPPVPLMNACHKFWPPVSLALD